jgi:hypothetical protein
MFYRAIAFIVFAFICLFANAQQKEQRVALVIGNSSYKSSPLKNPVNDARDMANSLRGYGFTVIERTNLTTRQVGQTLREFRSKLTPGSVAVVFYAGHGVQIKGENYLPTVDAEINGEEDVPMQSLSTRQIMDVLGEAKTRMNLVFLDACRDNPYARSFRSGSRGIAKENAPSGTLISFATRPGSVAGDGDGRNGLYTSVLLEQIRQTNQPIEQVLKRVVSGVKVASKGQQEPWMEGSIEGDFCFGQCTKDEQSNERKVTNLAVDLDATYWESIKDSNNFRTFDDYLEKFPNGKYLNIATLKRGNWVADKNGCKVLFTKQKTGKSASSSFGNVEQLSWGGECKDGKANGEGPINYKTGNFSVDGTASFMNGIPFGNRRLAMSAAGKKILFQGDVREVDVSGVVSVWVTYEDLDAKSTITGLSVGGVFQGLIKEKYQDGSEFEGEVIDGKRNGPGKVIHANKSILYSNFVDGKCEGVAKNLLKENVWMIGNVTSSCRLDGIVDFFENGKQSKKRLVAGQVIAE